MSIIFNWYVYFIFLYVKNNYSGSLQIFQIFPFNIMVLLYFFDRFFFFFFMRVTSSGFCELGSCAPRGMCLCLCLSLDYCWQPAVSLRIESAVSSLISTVFLLWWWWWFPSLLTANSLLFFFVIPVPYCNVTSSKADWRYFFRSIKSIWQRAPRASTA